MIREGFCYRFNWKSDPRHGHHFGKKCQIVKCMRFGNITIEFEDGERISVPRSALKLVEIGSNGKR